MFKDYYMSELNDLGVKTNNQGTPIDQLDQDELKQLLAIERYKSADGEMDSVKI